MATFTIAARNLRMQIDSARKLARLARETGGSIARERSKHFEFPAPADMRGIPAVGRGVGGAIAGTRPDAITRRDI